MNKPKIFLNFRNGDGQYAAAHAYRVLIKKFDRAEVFRSSESIEPGDDYINVLSTVPSECAVLIAFIGNHWLDIKGQSGQQRIFDDSDWVRREIAAALAANRRVVPVLLDNAVLPKEEELPTDISRLARCQYLHLRSRDIDSGFDKLIDKLMLLVPDLRASSSDPGPSAVYRINADRGGIVMAPIKGDINNFGTISRTTTDAKSSDDFTGSS